MRNTFILAVYEIDRAYGGSEEGGWWYDTGAFKRILRVERNEERAIALCARLNGWLYRLQKHKRSVDSVLYSGGRYVAQVWNNFAPKHYPEVRPHYE